MAESIQFEVEVPFGEGDFAPLDVSQQDPPGGPYEVQITGCRQVTKEGEGGKTTLRFNVVVTEDGPAKGLSTMVVIGCDWSKPFNLNHLKTLLVGMGGDPSKLKGNKKLAPAVFLGKKCYIFVKAPMEGETDDSGRPKRADKNFQTKQQYTAQKAAQAIAGGGDPTASAPVANTKSTPVAAPTAPVAGGDLNDMFPS